MNDDLEWWEQICLTPWVPQMELPEDLYVFFLRKNPHLQELIDRFDLDLEF